MKFVAGTVVLFAVATFLISQPGGGRQTVGPLPDGRFLLNSGWILQPAGKQIPLDTLPMSSALSPDGKYLLVLNGGYKPPSISVLSVAEQRELSRVPVADAWLGIIFTPNGKNVYVGGGSRASVYEFNFENGQLTPARTFEMTPAAQRTFTDFVGDVAVSPDGRLIYAAQLFHDTIAVINPAERPRHRAFQDRPPPVSDPVSSRRTVLFRVELGRRIGVSSPDQRWRAAEADRAGPASDGHGVEQSQAGGRRRR